MSNIHFHSEDVVFSLEDNDKISQWIQLIVDKAGFKLKELNFIFCSDEYLLNVNKEYLKHDYYTDIITFDNSEHATDIEGDIFVSIDRIKENASHFETSIKDELHRVIIHGVLHLLGYNDKTEEEEKQMRKLEDHYLGWRSFR